MFLARASSLSLNPAGAVPRGQSGRVPVLLGAVLRSHGARALHLCGAGARLPSDGFPFEGRLLRDGTFESEDPYLTVSSSRPGVGF